MSFKELTESPTKENALRKKRNLMLHTCHVVEFLGRRNRGCEKIRDQCGSQITQATLQRVVEFRSEGHF